MIPMASVSMPRSLQNPAQQRIGYIIRQCNGHTVCVDYHIGMESIDFITGWFCDREIYLRKCCTGLCLWCRSRKFLFLQLLIGFVPDLALSVIILFLINTVVSEPLSCGDSLGTGLALGDNPLPVFHSDFVSTVIQLYLSP